MTSNFELTYPLHWTDVPNNGVRKKISASQVECEELAKTLGVVSLSQVNADFEITRWRRTGLKIIADIRVDVVQDCVVSLENISSRLQEQAEWFFLPQTRPKKDTDVEIVLQIDPLAGDPADPLVDGKVDLGQLLTEHLCLMIDPFKRSDSVDFETMYKDVQGKTATELSTASPFAVLKTIDKKS